MNRRQLEKLGVPSRCIKAAIAALATRLRAPRLYDDADTPATVTLAVTRASADTRLGLSLQERKGNVVVSEVADGSPAAESGVERGGY